VPARRLRLRQVHPAAHRGGFRGRLLGGGVHVGQAHRGAGPLARHGVPGLRPVPLALGPRQHRLRPEIARAPGPRDPRHGRPLHRPRGPAGLRRRASAPSVGGHEAARRHRPGARQRGRGGADGRALRGARRHDPRAPAGRAPRPLEPHRPHRAVRHPRHRGGDLPRRPRRGDVAEPRPDRRGARHRSRPAPGRLQPRLQRHPPSGALPIARPSTGPASPCPGASGWRSGRW
jgi:hypothetical protein